MFFDKNSYLWHHNDVTISTILCIKIAFAWWKVNTFYYLCEIVYTYTNNATTRQTKNI